MHNRRRTVAGLSLAALSALALTGCYSVSYEKSSFTYNRESVRSQRLAMGDSMGMLTWNPVIEQRVALARTNFHNQVVSASAPSE